MYFAHASDRCTRKLSPLSTLLTSKACAPPLQISSEPYSSLLPLLSLRHRPAHSTCRWDLTGDLSNVPGILLKKQLSVLCSLKCKVYFIPHEPNSLQSLDALVVCCRWKIEVQKLGLVCFWHLVVIKMQFVAWS